jgi:hypothetical protein
MTITLCCITGSGPDQTSPSKLLHILQDIKAYKRTSVLDINPIFKSNSKERHGYWPHSSSSITGLVTFSVIHDLRVLTIRRIPPSCRCAIPKRMLCNWFMQP